MLVLSYNATSFVAKIKASEALSLMKGGLATKVAKALVYINERNANPQSENPGSRLDAHTTARPEAEPGSDDGEVPAGSGLEAGRRNPTRPGLDSPITGHITKTRDAWF